MPFLYIQQDFTNEVLFSISYVERTEVCNIRWKDPQTRRYVSINLPPRLVIDTITKNQENMFHDEMDRAIYIESIEMDGVQGVLRIPEIVMQMIYSEYRPELIKKKNYKSLVF